MNRSHIIVINTAATYTRSIITAGLALFANRWVLGALGDSDFGLFSVVGSIVIFIAFLNNVMSNSAVRHFSYASGQGDATQVRPWFNSALSLHLCFATALVAIGWPVGEFIIRHCLTIAPDRLLPALWVFRITLVSAFGSMVSVPFVGMFTAKQRIFESALFDLTQCTLIFILSYVLTRLSGDRLLIYAVGMTGIYVFVQVAIVTRASLAFPECRLNFSEWFNATRIRRIASFAGWDLITCLGNILRDQGTAVILNMRFGTKVNAAYGISTRVSTATNQFASAMLGAFTPEITASEGRGERDRMLALAQRANKFGTILVLLYAVPLFIEMDYVLKIWLKTPPEYTAIFCRLIILAFILERLCMGYHTAILAHGRIVAYQLTVGIISLLALPLVWFLLHLGYPPYIFGAAFIATMFACCVGRVFWMSRILGVPVSTWLRRTVLPCLIVTAASTAIGCAGYYLLHESFARLVCIIAATGLTTLAATWFAATDGDERGYLTENLKKLMVKIHLRRA